MTVFLKARTSPSGHPNRKRSATSKSNLLSVPALSSTVELLERRALGSLLSTLAWRLEWRCPRSLPWPCSGGRRSGTPGSGKTGWTQCSCQDTFGNGRAQPLHRAHLTSPALSCPSSCSLLPHLEWALESAPAAPPAVPTWTGRPGVAGWCPARRWRSHSACGAAASWSPQRHCCVGCRRCYDSGAGCSPGWSCRWGRVLCSPGCPGTASPHPATTRRAGSLPGEHGPGPSSVSWKLPLGPVDHCPSRRQGWGSPDSALGGLRVFIPCWEMDGVPWSCFSEDQKPLSGIVVPGSLRRQLSELLSLDACVEEAQVLPVLFRGGERILRN